MICADGAPVRFDPAAGLEGVIAIPPDPVPTREARAALPAEVPIADAVHNIAHASLLVLGLARGRLLADRRAAWPTASTSRAARTSTRARWSWCERAQELGARRRDDLGRGADGAVLVPLGADRGAARARCAREAPDCDVRRVTFVPGGADVKALDERRGRARRAAW